MSSSRAGASALLAAAILLLTLPAAGQSPSAPDFPHVSPGETVQGQLAPDAERLFGSRFSVFRIDVLAGERYAATVQSDAFTPHLVLMRPVGGITEMIREGAYGEEGRPTRLRIREDLPGPYLLVVRAADEDGSGPFNLHFEALPEPPPAVAVPITTGQLLDGLLSETGAIHLTEWDAEVAHELYRIDAAAGQTLLISMESDEFDSFLEFGPLLNGHIETIALDDDGGDGFNALLRVRIPEDGTYGIVARAFGEGQFGRYTLSVTERESVAAARRTLNAGHQHDAALTHDDADLTNNAYFQEWVFAGLRGQTASVRMRSVDFDTYAYLGQEANGGFTILAENDDAPDDGTNSLIVYTLPDDGEFIIRASSFSERQTGAYTIQLELE